MSRYPALEICIASDEEDDDINELQKLPINWEIFFDGEGRCFYHNNVTGVSQYDYPTVSLTDSPLANNIDQNHFFRESLTENVTMNDTRKLNLTIGTSTIEHMNDHLLKSASSTYQHVTQSMPSYMLVDNAHNISPKSMSPKHQHSNQSMLSYTLGHTNNVSPKPLSPNKYQHVSPSMSSYTIDNVGYAKSASPKNRHINQSMPSNILSNTNNVSPKSMSPKYQHANQSTPSIMINSASYAKSVSPKNQHSNQSMPSFMLDNTNNVSPKAASSNYQHSNQSMPSFMLDNTKSNHALISQMHDTGDIVPIHKLQINDSTDIYKDPSIAVTLLSKATSNASSIVYYSDMEEYSDMDNEEDEDVSMNAAKNEINYVSPRYWLQPARCNKENISKQVRLNQDYLALAREYTRLKPYTDYNSRVTCVICAKSDANVVFFPCEHRSVCNNCIKNEKICEDRMLSSVTHGHSNCPVCAQIIKLILPHENGKEVDKYWSWVFEVVPALPSGFIKRWKHTAAVLTKVYVTDDTVTTYDNSSMDRQTKIREYLKRYKEIKDDEKECILS